MAARIAINGFGRIGRETLKALLNRYPETLEVVAINDLADAKILAHLFKYDSTYGIYSGVVQTRDDKLVVDGREIAVVSVRDISKLPWAAYGVDIAIESTGIFTDGLQARNHLEAGAKKVIITAPSKNEDIMVVLGVNEDRYRPAEHHIISNASCTTNCLAPVAKVIHESFVIKRGLMSTVHAYTNDQRILDQVHRDLRRARTAAVNIIPTSTGAARAVGVVFPEVKGKVHGIAFRVPTQTVSAIDFVVDLQKETTNDQVNATLKAAAEGPLSGILEYCEEPLVSMDFKGNPASAIVDALSTIVMDGTLAKIVAWYDNEWGYCCRVADLASYLTRKGL